MVDGRRFALAAPNDPRYPGGLTTVTPSAGQWYLRANGGEVKASINVEAAWSRATGTGQVVAVLDTGITNHPDLAGKLLPGYDFVGYSVDDLPTANDGDLVQVKDHRQRFIGVGFFNSKSKINVRLLAPDRIEIDEAFFEQRIREALALRTRYLPGASSFRKP